MRSTPLPPTLVGAFVIAVLSAGALHGAEPRASLKGHTHTITCLAPTESIGGPVRVGLAEAAGSRAAARFVGGK